ncbi:Zn-dependent exopeptidase M28 [Vibrio gallaecicus]|uniref:Zn-dependent exopeptidase M28 n=1 Tax=Vibrio gallaecicus TaxID=552386 RepID=UPI0010C9F942|nr:Zn-dependent exopeptidase M28 [Vibrio gallaecicus]MDN3617520.1 Zn-dependent exopeptidase M28 [Vibrio gallaecicus]
MQEEKRSYIARSSGKSSKLKLSYRRSISVLTSVVKIQNWHRSTVVLFFGAATFGLPESNFFAETLLVEFVGTKVVLLAEIAFSLVW